MKKILLIGLSFYSSLIFADTTGWTTYAGGQGQKYSQLDQIRKENVGNLIKAWEFSTGEHKVIDGRSTVSSFQVAPIVIGKRMFICTPKSNIIALNAESGDLLWKYEPKIKKENLTFKVCRGLSYWKGPEGSACQHRIYSSLQNGELVALNAMSSKAELCRDFGTSGKVNLKEDLGSNQQSNEVTYTSPPLVFDDSKEKLLIVGGSIADNRRINPPSGVIRAFDLVTGKLKWAFDPAPKNMSLPVNTAVDGKFVRGTPNSWSVMTADLENGIIFIPMGNASPDYFGGQRHTNNLSKYSSALVALEARTGKVKWYFKTVYNDIWDYDLAAQPILASIDVNGIKKEVVIQTTKSGMVFVIDRHTGESVYGVEEKPVPQTQALPGERLSSVQPYPVFPPVLDIKKMKSLDETHLDFISEKFSPKEAQTCRDKWSNIESTDGGRYQPRSLLGSLSLPGPYGGFNWSGCSINPDSHLLICNAMHFPAYFKFYKSTDPICKGGRAQGIEQMLGTPYCAKFSSTRLKEGYSCLNTPKGELIAFDLSAYGDSKANPIKWKIPLGFQAGKPGAHNIGGTLSTASNLTFIGSTSDKMFRAYDSQTGQLLKEIPLPAAGAAAPITYEIDGNQYIAIAAGGHYVVSYDRVFDDTLHVFKLNDKKPAIWFGDYKDDQNRKVNVRRTFYEDQSSYIEYVKEGKTILSYSISSPQKTRLVDEKFTSDISVGFTTNAHRGLEKCNKDRSDCFIHLPIDDGEYLKTRIWKKDSNGVEVLKVETKAYNSQDELIRSSNQVLLKK